MTGVVRRRWLATAVLAAAVFTTIAVSVGAGAGWLLRIDRSANRAVHAFGAGHPATVTAARVITNFGDPIVVNALLAIATVYALLRRRWRWATAIVLGRAVQLTTSTGVKDVIGRPRPVFTHPFAVVVGGSFPSGHAGGTALAGVVLGCLAWRAGRDAPRPAVTGLALAVAVGWPVAVAVSRVALGVHYVSDVVGGAALGLAAGSTTVAAGTPHGDDREDRVQTGHT